MPVVFFSFLLIEGIDKLGYVGGMDMAGWTADVSFKVKYEMMGLVDEVECAEAGGAGESLLLCHQW